jgi:hypothetical protein
VRHLLGGSPALDVIVASRSAFPLPFAAQCPLDRMPPNEAVALLKAAGAGQVAVSDEQAGRIAELCGFNALELSLVGGLLGGRSCTPEVRLLWGLCDPGLGWLNLQLTASTDLGPMLTGFVTHDPPQDVIAAGSAVAASDQTYFDPIRPHIERLRTWWTALLGPALGQPAQSMTGAMALSVFGGSFDGDSAAAVLTAVVGCNAQRLLTVMSALCVLQDAGAWTGEAGLGRLHADTRHAPSTAVSCHATPPLTSPPLGHPLTLAHRPAGAPRDAPPAPRGCRRSAAGAGP